MSLTTEQLMQPRYKVIADYPGANYQVGEIVTFFWSGRFTQMLCDKPPMLDASGRTITGLATAEWFDRYPAIFQKLQWWEDRAVEDMPDYVKIETDCTNINRGDIIKVDKWLTYHMRAIVNRDDTLWPNDLLPATEQEYLTYQKSNQ